MFLHSQAFSENGNIPNIIIAVSMLHLFLVEGLMIIIIRTIFKQANLFSKMNLLLSAKDL